MFLILENVIYVLLHNYPESTQYILIHLNKNEFYFNNEENMWHTNYQTILDQIITYYNAQDNMIQENSKPFLSSKAQRDSDRQLIKEWTKCEYYGIIE